MLTKRQAIAKWLNGARGNKSAVLHVRVGAALEKKIQGLAEREYRATSQIIQILLLEALAARGELSHKS